MPPPPAKDELPEDVTENMRKLLEDPNIRNFVGINFLKKKGTLSNKPPPNFLIVNKKKIRELEQKLVDQANAYADYNSNPKSSVL